MRYQLKILEGPEGIGKTIVLNEGENFLGRVAAPQTIQLNGTKLSKKHCVFIKNQNSLIVKDLNSSNGIFLNGQKIVQEALKENDRLVIGDYTFEIGMRN